MPSESSAGVRLPAGRVTVLLGPDEARRRLVGSVDGRGTQVLTVTAGRACTAAERLDALATAARQEPALVLVARLTDGLAAPDRRAVLGALRVLAARGPAVLVDDTDPVAALAVADGALRVGPDGVLRPEDLGGQELDAA
jgi:hypothetical protein